MALVHSVSCGKEEQLAYIRKEAGLESLDKLILIIIISIQP
jgi:hypothetical protein